MIGKRTLLKSTAAASALTVFSGLVPGLATVVKAAAKPRVRRSVNNMNLDDPDLSAYRDFVGIMRGNPATDRVSWIGFANQHGNEEDYKFCPHGDWYFLPWHRAYVQMYENAVAALTKTPNFAMPYWDWTTLRQLPQAFTDPKYKGKPNPLFSPGPADDPTMVRNPLVGADALTDGLVGSQVMKSIYDETDYEMFGTTRNPSQKDLNPKWVPAGGGRQGTMERTPHNNVHNNIGGYMPQANSPRDPIFMMHHGNIDRIWAHWNALGRKNSVDPLWLNMVFADNYIAVDGTPNGKTYSRAVKDLQSTEALGYTYDDLPKADGIPVDTRRNQNVAALFNPAATAKPLRLRAATTDTATAAAHMNTAFALPGAPVAPVVAAVRPPGQAREVLAIISDIVVGDNVRAIRVFVNRESVAQDVPDTDPHFVATLSFLKHKGHAGHGALPSAVVNLTTALRKLSDAKGIETDKISVQLLPVLNPKAPAGATGRVTPGSIEISFV